MSYKIGFNAHGKGRVRLVKVTRKTNDVHVIQQLSVQILLEGYDMNDVYEDGDNSKVIPTDTCKNTVYCLAHSNAFDSIESFGIIICKHFLNEYPTIVKKLSVLIIEDNWERLQTPNTNNLISTHNHAFKRIGPCQKYSHIQGHKLSKNSNDISIMTSNTASLFVIPFCRLNSTCMKENEIMFLYNYIYLFRYFIE